MTRISLTVGFEDEDKRLDVFCSENTSFTRSAIRNMLDDGKITLNGKTVKAGYALKESDQIEIDVPEPRPCVFQPEDIPIDIIYQDDDIAVVNKPQGMVTHPADGAWEHTLVNALLFKLDRLSDINGVIRPGIVHRLDKNTSGLLVVAKNNAAHLDLSKQIASKQARRIYVALVDGNIKEDAGIIDQPLGRSLKDRKKIAVTIGGRDAQTHFKVLERYGLYTLVEYELKTGRTHQIRVHSAYIGHPVVGDDVYGGSNKFNLNGQLLHAKTLILTHPTTKKEMVFNAPLPDYFEGVLKKIEHLRR